ncbi:hypothetical protein [Novipirellula artificiosorum]|nr:hypothetical protein [Novipirellula artificiosorum]
MITLLRRFGLFQPRDILVDTTIAARLVDSRHEKKIQICVVAGSFLLAMLRRGRVGPRPWLDECTQPAKCRCGLPLVRPSLLYRTNDRKKRRSLDANDSLKTKETNHA